MAEASAAALTSREEKLRTLAERLHRRTARARRFPLSFAQQRLWFLDQLDPGSAAYHILMVVRLRGEMRTAPLARAVREIIRRHGTLRTIFAVVDDELMQVVLPEATLALPVIDLSALGPAMRHAEGRRLAAASGRLSFDLGRAPLLRIYLLRLDDREALLPLTLHHIVADGWSLDIFTRELTALYEAFRQGRASPLPELPIQYSDFAVWQRRRLAGERLDSQLAYWRAQLDGVPHLDLPADRRRPAVRTAHGAWLPTALPHGQHAALAALARRLGATLFMTLLAGFQALLHRLTGADDVCVGTPIAGRPERHLEGLIGLFVNTLVLRGDLAGRPSFAELVGRVRTVSLDAFAHQDLPFERLVAELHPERDLSRTPLFQVMFLLQARQGGQAAPVRLAGLTFEPVAADSRTAKFDLTLTLEEGASGLSGNIEYSTDLFDAATIRRLLQHLEALLGAAVEQTEAPLQDLPLLSPSEIHHLLGEHNDTAPAGHAEARAATLVAAIEAQVDCAPWRVAVSCDGRCLSYGELDARANRLAHCLLGLGAGLDLPVAICVERSLEAIVGLLGILKAGAAYVPLDPSYPAERLSFMIADALGAGRAGGREVAPGVLLTQQHLVAAGVAPAAAGDPAIRAIRLDADWDLIGRESPQRLAPDAGPLPDSLCYVIYTSGSTGRPKGAANAHRPVYNRVRWMQATWPHDAADRVLQKTPLSFDVSVWELFWPLLAGARLVLAKPDGHRDAAYLVEVIEREAVTTLHFVPSMLQVFLEQPDLGRCASLQRVIASGEALSGDLARRFAARLAGVELHNLYGPTEAAVDVTWHHCRGEEGASVPIGRPIAGAAVYLLDRRGHPVPLGAAGELHLGGLPPGRGYLARPHLTAERFVPDAFGGEPGARLYRTGDLARRLAGGEIDYLGRLDNQIKIRGLRVELGEIEAVLASHPGAREALVVIREVGNGAAEPRIVAYVTGPASLAVDELRRRAAQHLPAYMVPAAIVVLPELPLLPNGKVDRRGLPDPVAPGAARGAGGAPRQPREQLLAGIWREVLGIEDVGLRDNFFDLGGHSLKLIEVQTKLRKVTGSAPTVVELFQYPTLEALAALLERSEVGSAPEAPPMSPVATAAPSPVPAPVAGAAVRESGGDLAIIGMAGRFPGAPDLAAFWRNLRGGVESIRPLGREQLLAAGRNPDTPGLVAVAAILDGIELVDAAFFGLSPREAELLDPQQRLFLECSWECLEAAGCDPGRFAGRIGLFAGAGWTSYALHVFAHPEILELVDPLTVQTSLDKDFLATRAAYLLGLRGPCVSVQTACSTSLVALHMARQAILSGDCEMALAGGVSLRIPQDQGYVYEEGGIRSPDGHCRAFDAQARGTVFGSGVGVVLLKALDAALRDGDLVHAVLTGTAVNNDGSQRVGFTAPGIDGQAQVVEAALRAAGVSPTTVTYVEAHGTATPLGDPIEVAALTRAFRTGAGGGTAGRGYCALGSVKTNVGHLDTAAGMAGLLKTVLSLEHREIPPSLHFTAPNSKIDLADSPFYVNTELRPWPAAPGPRRAGVSSFGVGGTNAHAVLEEAPAAAAARPSVRPWQLLPISARSAEALDMATQRLADHLGRNPQTDLADVAWTLQTGRRAFEHRRIAVCGSTGEAAASLATGSRLPSRRAAGERPAVAFLFPGQGAQHPGMGRDLYEHEPVFRAEIDRCAELLGPRPGRDLLQALYPPPGLEAGGAAALGETILAQPALFAVEVALARLWLSRGIEPRAMIGHSLGELSAACIAGVFSLPDALALVVARGEMMQACGRGAMLAVDLAAPALAPLLSPGLAIAADNGPAQAVASGPLPEIAALEQRLTDERIPFRRLHTSHAFHSAAMDPVLGPFRELVARTERRPPALPFVSNLSGGWITASEAVDPRYWSDHLRRPVRFGEGLKRLMADLGGRPVLLEVGPGHGLATVARQLDREVRVVSSLKSRRRAGSDLAALLEATGRLWLEGLEPAWERCHGSESRRRVELPTYPFERRRFWLDPGTIGVSSRSAVREPGPPATAPPDGEPDSVPAVRQPGLTCHPRPDLETAFRAPRDESERVLATLWQELLGVGPVGIDDDFFELGGHSLLATRLLSRLRDVGSAGPEIGLEQLFGAATIAELAAALRARPDAAGARPQPPALQRVARDGPLPLSFAQQRLWFLDRLDPGSPAYNTPAAVSLHGSLAPEVLRAVLGEVVRRHEALRTTFHLIAGEAAQVVSPPRRFALPLIDLMALPPSARRHETERLIRREAARPFDLSRDLLLRGALLAVASGEHIALLTMHHIASDGWSIGVLIREVGVLYEAFSIGRPSPLLDLELQYVDFAIWQRRCLTPDVLASEVEWWRQCLAGVAVLDLPTDRPRPAVQTFPGAVRETALQRRLLERVQLLARGSKATPFMVLLAAFQALLGRHATQSDVAVGSPVAGRRHSATEPLIGFFVNTLVFRADLTGDPAFGDHLARVRELAIGAFEHQDLPFEKLVEELQPDRELSRTPLFQVLFVLQNVPSERLAFHGVELAPLTAETGSARFDLTLALGEGPAGPIGMSGRADYNRDLFDGTSVERLLRHYLRLLEGAVCRPETPLSALPLLDAGERHQLLAEWSGTEGSGTEGSGGDGWLSAADCLHQPFERLAAREPDAVALIHGRTRWTRGRLNRAANRLARVLRRHGVGPEVRVGVLLERTPALLAALLAVLKSGGAYVPLDPAYPPERLAQTLEDSATTVLVTQQRFAELVPAERRPPILLLVDAGRRTIARQPAGDLTCAAGPGNLAYVIYTSGSTGRPKGVAIEHRGAVDLLRWGASAIPGEALAGVLASTSICFDLSVFEIFLPLARGGTVILADNALALPSLPARCQVTLVNTVPSAMAALAAGELPPGLTTVCLAGEPLRRQVVEEVLRHRQVQHLYNLYGPSEDTTYSTGEEVGADGPVTIGRPLPGKTLAWLLDRALEPVPAGVLGEVHLTGTGLARGYLGRPDLTAERFLPAPCGSTPGSRLYRTGDLARFLPDGRIDFVGRLDHQVKIRGFRVELGEIEAALRGQPGVLDVVVLAREHAPGDMRLAAFVVTTPSQPADLALLREALRSRLPEHLVPARITALAELPRLPNGKIDRRSLPLEEVEEGSGGGLLVPPRTTVEAALLRIWEELLGVRQIGVTDRFFDLGGHSLLSVRMMARIKERFGVDLPLATLFTASTIESLAAQVAAGGAAWSQLVAIEPRGSKTPLFLVHPIGGQVYGYYALSTYLDRDRPLYALQAAPLDAREAQPASSLEEMAGRYLAEVRRVRPRGPYLLGGWSFGGLVAFEMAQQVVRAGEEVGALILLDTAAPRPDEVGPEPDSAALMAALLQEHARHAGLELQLVAEDLAGLPRSEQLIRALAALHAARLVGPEVDTGLLDSMLRGYEARKALAEGYHPEIYPGRVQLARAVEIEAEERRHLPAAALTRLADPTLGWGALAAGGVDVRIAPGHHDSLLSEPHVREVARHVLDLLAAAEAGASGVTIIGDASPFSVHPIGIAK